MAFDIPAPPPLILTPEDRRRLRPLIAALAGVDFNDRPPADDTPDRAAQWARGFLLRLCGVK